MTSSSQLILTLPVPRPGGRLSHGEDRRRCSRVLGWVDMRTRVKSNTLLPFSLRALRQHIWMRGLHGYSMAKPVQYGEG